MLPDEIEYLRLSFEGLSGEHVRQPLYPLFLMATGKAALVWQILLQAGTAGLTFFLAGAVFSDGEDGKMLELALPFAFLASPYLWFFTTRNLSETLFTFLFTAFVLFLAMRQGTFTRWLQVAVMTGVILGLLILTRSAALGLLVMPFVVGARHPRVIVGVALALQIPWQVHLCKQYSQFLWTSPGGGITLYESLNPEATGGPAEKPLPPVPGETLADQDREYLKRAAAWAWQNPRRVLELAKVKAMRFWSPLPNAPGYGGVPALLCGVWEALLLLFAFLGFLEIVAMRGNGVWASSPSIRTVIWCVLYFPALHLVYLGSVRYRMPIEPLLVVLAVFYLRRNWFR